MLMPKALSIPVRLFSRWRRGLALAWLLVGGFGLVWPPVCWGAERLDDSQSPRRAYHQKMQWARRDSVSQATEAERRKLIGEVAHVEVRLDTSAYIGRQADIFLTLPDHIVGFSGSAGFQLSWKTRGLFSTGSVAPGQRALIFRGQVNSPQLIEFFTFTIEVDAQRLTGEIRYAPSYEIELH